MTTPFGSSRKAASADHRVTIDMNSRDNRVNEPWYRNPWVWLIISIPSLTVIGGIITLYLAISRPDYLVDDAALKEETPTSLSQ